LERADRKQPSGIAAFSWSPTIGGKEKLKAIVRPRRFTEQGVVRLASHMTERDRQIALDCFDHRVLTTDQIKRPLPSGATHAG
jgi:hypothetical protein